MAQDTLFDMSWALYFFNSSCTCPPVYVVVDVVDVDVVVVVELGVTSDEEINHRSCANENNFISRLSPPSTNHMICG